MPALSATAPLPGRPRPAPQRAYDRSTEARSAQASLPPTAVMRAATPRGRRLLRAEAVLLAAATQAAATQAAATQAAATQAATKQTAATRASASQAAVSQKLVQVAARPDVPAIPSRAATGKKPARANGPGKTVPRETATRSSHQAAQPQAVGQRTLQHQTVPHQTSPKHPWTGEAILALRARLSVSQETLATLIGRHVRCVTQWERRGVTPDVASSIALWALAEQPAHAVHATLWQIKTRREGLLQAAVAGSGAAPSRGAQSPASPDPPGGWNGATIQALRARLGVSRRELARLIGVGYGTVADWEGKGRAVGPRSVLLLRAVRAMTVGQVGEAVARMRMNLNGSVDR